ncbi:UDP-N-acetylmuramoyl-tripeptide--D-alanyl-D-alanine ligase [Oceanihabitans sediminis]|uniref:UDP-N-acetylmuramoyl-tripeptide--D-alanyl-D-alanine ligase n=2 Tax=Oceanihabitans sediminis TaxID=1812012 RepID=A0A368P7Q0_9FLAO|nr:UDP-N-acetylmuramoyl-tripeptide--D-alanyl-D-alanine ligase [Oceanihabitans sediminis]RBP29949.1 UDP-N-acetylmuramoyl-tripeptide--D-alanyl-D-alanine ligase [Oceanihabitans sediminis]RCU57281.1 UDP-N-acetylmuramoyl-tripeptide--D-alanyl-D-alanine ligase [Oceanihabitans sediminis]
MKIEQLHQLYLQCNKVSTDTRKIENNSLFFALKGENFNGNTFAKQAIENGAKYVVIDEEAYAIEGKTLLVDNVLKTLQKLASYHRDYLKVKIISLTGSNGKTTTKELINATLSQKFKTVATIGNLNNHIGVPLTLLSMDKSTEIGIVEMGANHLKEIEFLCNIAKPDYGYITNFGKAHLEGFGSIEGVIQGKTELYQFLKENNKHIFFNADDFIQEEKLQGYKLKFGFTQTKEDYYKIELEEANPFVVCKVENTTITSNLIGAYNFMNLSAAISIASYFKVDLKAIKKGIENYTPNNNRSQIITVGSNKVVLDAYNANPTSMQAALNNFSKLKSTNKIVILGDMFELGSEAEAEHQNIAGLSLKLGFDKIYLVGENFYKTELLSDRIEKHPSFAAFKENFKKPENANLLIKGSRGMALERTLELL